MGCTWTVVREEGFVELTGRSYSHSKIRTSVLGKEMTASPTGLSAYRLIVRAPASPQATHVTDPSLPVARTTDPEGEAVGHPTRISDDDRPRPLDDDAHRS